MMSCSTEKNAANRERELYRYYQPVDSPTPLPNGDSGKRSATDPILTTFAQLGALRCNTRRGLITLSSSNTEYILAESGQRLSLQKDDDEADKLWHGEGKLTKQTGIGPTVSNLFSMPGGPSHLYCGDLTQHPIFKDKPTVTGPPHIRAIAAVPLKTPIHGIVIGTYILLDDKIREEPEMTSSSLEFMEDMAVTIMDYLESGRLKKQQHRAERMVKAMGLFIEGKSSLREWWINYGHKHQQAAAMKKRSKTPEERLVQEADREFGVQEVTDYFSRSSLSGLNDNTVHSSGPATPSSGISGDHPGRDGRPAMPRGDTVSTETGRSSTFVSKAWHERNSSTTTFDTFSEQVLETEKQSSVSFDLSPVTDISRDLQDDVLSSEVEGVFARSSNLIREAIGVEGVLYYDASVGSFGGSFERDVIDEKAPGAFDMRHAATSSEDDTGKKIPEQSPESNERYCNVLGFSTRSRSTLRGHAVSEEHKLLSDTVMRRLLKRYPHGKVFNFDSDGTCSDNISENKPSPNVKDARSNLDNRSEAVATRKLKSREVEAKAILQVLPGARSVFFFPLWDQSRERWFSGSLIWSISPSRTLCPVEDITYLAAFGNSTMAEIIKISAAVLSKMKTDFISSISHELRSPLHGVLASVEFLQETEMTEIQTDLISYISASGNVLLDTINHVLDFSKVNRKTKNKRRTLHRTVSRQKNRQPSVDDTVDEVADICVLSEEVLDSIYAGRSVSKNMNASGGTNYRQRQLSQTNEPPITIIVDIQWRSNWTFLVDPGAWRRVLMNIFSNALKYTKQGFVQVSLEIEDDISSQRKISRSNLTLKLKDSGKGISQEFLRHQLYKPFTQEDTLATGAGLGLSIVKAIVQDLGGRIDFISEPGSGTEVTVRIPLNASNQVKHSAQNAPEQVTNSGLNGSNDTIRSESPDSAEEDGLNTMNKVRAKTTGLKFSLGAFDRYPEIPTGILSADEEAAMLLKSSVQKTLTDWFDMKVTSDPADADVVVIMESGLGDKSLEDTLQSYPASGKKAVVIVLTSSYHPKYDSHCHLRVFYLQQPNGPHKFAKILHQAFCQPEPEMKIATSGLKIERSGLLTTPECFGLETKSQDIQIVDPGAPDAALHTQIIFPASATYDFAPVMHVENVPPGLGTLALALSPVSPPAESPVPEVTASQKIKDHAVPVRSKEPAVTVQQEDGMRVLLVEDNEINLKLLVATMRKLKLDHVTATNGLEALNSYKDCNGNFNVIFMDISMPVMSGIESSRQIRRYEKENNLEPVALIALTGAANPSTRQEAFSSGVDLYLTKPVPMKALRGMLDDLRREGRGAFAG